MLLYFALRGIEWARVWAAIAEAGAGYLTACALTTCGSFFLRSLRWRVLLNAEARFSVGTVFSATMAGYLGNSFLPARAGEVIRSFIISSHSSLTKTYVLTTALAERVMDAVALVLWSSVVLLGVNPKPQWLSDVSWTTALIAAAGALGIVILPHASGLCERIIGWIPLPGGIRERLLHLARQVLSGLRAFHDARRLAGFVLLTAAIWGLDAFGLVLAGYAFHLPITYTVAALLISALGLGSAVAATPGYVGTFQFIAVTVLGPFGISRDAALALILVVQALGYIVVLVLGLPAILRYRGWSRKTPVS